MPAAATMRAITIVQRKFRATRPGLLCEICADTELALLRSTSSTDRLAHNARFKLDSITTPNDDVLREEPCEHNFCVGCVRNYLVTEIMENSRSGMLCCPAPDCANRFFPPDVWQLLTIARYEASSSSVGCEYEDTKSTPTREREKCQRALAKYDELLTADYGARLRDIFDTTDGATVLLLFRKSRLCPGCQVILTRNGGCPDFYCSCGENFHFWSAPRVMHYAWEGGPQSYTQVLECAVKESLTFEEAVAHFLARRKRTIGKHRVLLRKYHQVLRDTAAPSAEEIEALARGAALGAKHALAAVKGARSTRDMIKQRKAEARVKAKAGKPQSMRHETITRLTSFQLSLCLVC
jgi:hypothetical protein